MGSSPSPPSLCRYHHSSRSRTWILALQQWNGGIDRIAVTPACLPRRISPHPRWTKSLRNAIWLDPPQRSLQTVKTTPPHTTNSLPLHLHPQARRWSCILHLRYGVYYVALRSIYCYLSSMGWCWDSESCWRMRPPSDLDGQGQKYVGCLPTPILQDITRCTFYTLSFGCYIAIAVVSRISWRVGSLLTVKFSQIFPSGRSSRSIGPGIEIRADPAERIRREQDLDDMTSLEWAFFGPMLGRLYVYLASTGLNGAYSVTGRTVGAHNHTAWCQNG